MKPNLHHARFYGILDTGYTRPEAMPAMCQELLSGDADIIQLRAKGVPYADQRSMIEACLPCFEKTEVPFILNDHLDLALDLLGPLRPLLGAIVLVLLVLYLLD